MTLDLSNYKELPFISHRNYRKGFCKKNNDFLCSYMSLQKKKLLTFTFSSFIFFILLRFLYLEVQDRN